MAGRERDGSQGQAVPVKASESTYSRILQDAIDVVRRETGWRNKVRGFSRQLTALGLHTKKKLNALSFIGKLLVFAIVVASLSGIGLGVVRVLRAAQPNHVRHDVLASIRARDFIAAKEQLDALSTLTGGLSIEDREVFARPIYQGLRALTRELQAGFQNAVSAKHWNEALDLLERMDKAATEPEWTLFSRAEVLRLSGRSPEAARAYGHFIERYPFGVRTGDALFWQALALNDSGDRQGARLVLMELLSDYPHTKFKSSATRLLTEIDQR